MESSSLMSIGGDRSTNWRQAHFLSEKRRRASDVEAVADAIQCVHRSSLPFLPSQSSSYSDDRNWRINRVGDVSESSSSGIEKRKRRDSITIKEAEALYDFQLGVQLEVDSEKNRITDDLLIEDNYNYSADENSELFESNEVASNDEEQTEIFEDYFENSEKSSEHIVDRSGIEKVRTRDAASFLSRYSELATMIEAQNREEYTRASECKEEQVNPLFMKKLTLNEFGKSASIYLIIIIPNNISIR